MENKMKCFANLYFSIAYNVDCVHVNHIYDNPGFLTCDCVEPSDQCLKDGQCTREPRCVNAGTKFIVSAPYFQNIYLD